MKMEFVTKLSDWCNDRPILAIVGVTMFINLAPLLLLWWMWPLEKAFLAVSVALVGTLIAWTLITGIPLLWKRG